MNSNHKRILFIASGVLGPLRGGNQSLGNTILGFLRAGYRVYHFSLTSRKDGCFDFSTLDRYPEYRMAGMPSLLLGFFRRFNRRPMQKLEPLIARMAPEMEWDLGETEVTMNQNLVTIMYAVFETVRMGLRALFLRPAIMYGYEVNGAFPARAVAALFGVTSITRFQGTYVTEKNMNNPVMVFHTAALKLKAHGVVINNDGTRGDIIARTLGIEPQRLYFKPNGLDDRLFRGAGASRNDALRLSLNTSSSRFVAGIFTRFYPYKRVDRSLMLLERLLREGVSLHLVIAGSGPLEGALKKMAEERKISGHITWCGTVSYNDMGDYYRSCDLMFHLNDYANINNQVLEAIHCKIPLIALDDKYNSGMFGDCPYARFISREQLTTLAWGEVEALIARRGIPYASPHIRPWRERMAEEVEWIEGLPQRKRHD